MNRLFKGVSVLDRTCPSAPGDTLVFENNRVHASPMTLEPGRMFDFHQHHYGHVALWQDSGQAVTQHLGDPQRGILPAAEPGFVRFHTAGAAESLAQHRSREVSERSPSERRLPGQANGRGTFIGPNSEEQA